MQRRPYKDRKQETTLICSNNKCDNVSAKLRLVEEKIIDALREWLVDYKLNIDNYMNKREKVIPKLENIIDIYPNLKTAEEKNLLLKTVLKRVDYLKDKKGEKDKKDLADFRLDLYPNISNKS